MEGDAGLLPAIAGELTALGRRLGEGARNRADVWNGQPPQVAPTIDRAVRCFDLSPIERDLIVLLLGATLGFGARGAGPVRALELVAALGTTRERAAAVIAALEPDRPLTKFELVTVAAANERTLDGTIALAAGFWPRLLGIRPATAPQCVERASPALSELALPDDLADRAAALRAWLAATPSATLVIHGPAGSGRGALAAAIAAEVGTGIVLVPGSSLTAATSCRWRRELAWHEGVPVVTDAELADPAVLGEIATGRTGKLVLAAETPLLERLSGPGRSVRLLSTSAIDDRTRGAIWRFALARAGVDTDNVDAGYLGTRFPFAPRRIVAAAASIAVSGSAPTTADAVAMCRAVPEARLGGLATQIDTRFTWDDLIVSSAVRSELELVMTWGRRAGTLFAPGGMGSRARAPRGLTCLFHGPPGTGKTLAAQVVARELGAELYRVDLAQIVDKYLGETEKRLDLLFREAEAAGVILLFDEADALFAQRTAVRESRDRYANLETGFLLQRLEDHRGLTILASNLLRNLDPAFQRRLGVVVEFPLPGPGERAQIWERMLPEPPHRAADVDVTLLAERIPLAGGDIRNTVFAAVLLAGRDGDTLAMHHLVVASWRELAKAGRVVNPSDFGAWRHTIVEYARSRQ